MTLNVDLNLPKDFDNEVRLFPLPELVLFPGVMQGLHIFEPRYLTMLDDVLKTDHRLIGMAQPLYCVHCHLEPLVTACVLRHDDPL